MSENVFSLHFNQIVPDILSQDKYFFKVALSSLISDKLSKNYNKSFIYFADLAKKRRS